MCTLYNDFFFFVFVQLRNVLLLCLFAGSLIVREAFDKSPFLLVVLWLLLLFCFKFFISFVLFAHIDVEKRECAAFRWFIYICASFFKSFFFFAAIYAHLSTADRIPLQNWLHMNVAAAAAAAVISVCCSHTAGMPQSSANWSFHIYESSFPSDMAFDSSIVYLPFMIFFVRTNDHHLKSLSVNSLTKRISHTHTHTLAFYSMAMILFF